MEWRYFSGAGSALRDHTSPVERERMKIIENCSKQLERYTRVAEFKIRKAHEYKGAEEAEA